MEAKQIYNEFYKRFDLTQWFDEKNSIVEKQEFHDESDVNYSYLGVGDEFQVEKFLSILNEFFGENQLYVTIMRSKGFLLETAKIPDEISPFVGKKEIGIMNEMMGKMLFFSHIGSFKKGIYKEFPKERERQIGTPLNVRFGANMYELKTEKVVKAVRDIFPKIEADLHLDYGGKMEHLWIDLVLVEGHKPFNFRFQKRVGVKNISNTATANYYYNVGHYSVKPDFKIIKTLNSKTEICAYIFELLHQSMEILEKKNKSLGDFNAKKFREDFKSVALTGYDFND